jgi:hypothetical protein
MTEDSDGRSDDVSSWRRGSKDNVGLTSSVLVTGWMITHVTLNR